MIRKPPAAWNQPDEDRAVRTIRTASAVARTGYGAAQRGGKAFVGLFCYFFAAIWGFAALASGLAGSLPSLVGIGAMAAFMFWAGRRSFAKARGG
ncbi:MAG: hypothetical protein ACRC1G_19290 [Bradyrhizobium sp.]|nr:hypothetical protein [Bradyrhizobium sp.]